MDFRNLVFLLYVSSFYGIDKREKTWAILNTTRFSLFNSSVIHIIKNKIKNYMFIYILLRLDKFHRNTCTYYN